ncbi:MAG: peptidylprolyl isomerase [Rhodocyclales bacterium]|nr:peptidylprolyl isomerase [Rhodocyclales bacterium]
MIFRLLLLCLLTALPSAHAQSRRANPIEVDRIVAVVNDEAITAFELRSRLATVERQLKGQNVQLPPRDVLERQLLERMISDRVQTQFARETGLRVSDIELDAALRRIAESNRLPLPDFRAALEKDGIAWPKFREEIRQEIILSRLRDREINSRVAVSEGEVDNYLANQQQGTAEQGTEVHVAHIVLRVPEQATPDQLMRIGARAKAALDQIRRGEDFAKVAAAYSDAPDGLSSGGSLGMRPLDRLPALYASVVQKLKPGESSEILRSPAGFHILKLIEKRSQQNTSGTPAVAPLKQTHARHILIKVNELVSEAEAQHKLVALKERLDNGADFAELARLYSNDLSAAKGGDLGWLYPGDTVPEFEKAMDALKINEVSQPVQSPFGFHLIQVLERRTEEAGQERQRLMARQVLRERKADEAYQDWVRQLRDRAHVEYRLENQ